MPLNAMARGALSKLDAMLRQKGLMAATLFRDRKYNTSYNAGDDLLDAVEFQGILDKAGVALSAADARAIVAGIDQDGNGELDIKELLDAIRASQRTRAAAPERDEDADDDDAGIAATRFTPRSPRHAPGVASPSRRHIAIFFEKY